MPQLPDSQNLDPLRSKVVLITGCSSGIGRALALAFQKQGYRVYATARNLETVKDLSQQGMVTLQLDVTDKRAIKRVIHRIIEEVGGIDILVNNAGYGVMGPLLDIPDAEFEQQFQTNVFAPIHLAQAIAPVMMAKSGGLIIMMGSVSGMMSTPFAGPYCASKAALHALADALRMELAPFNIQVVTVQAGAIQSNFGQAATRNVERLLKSTSLYKSLVHKIRERAQASQEQATPTSVFAKKLVQHIEHQPLPPVISLGRKSILLPFLKRWLPTRILDQILTRKFGLSSLQVSRQPDP